MVEFVYLGPGDEMPELPDSEPWLAVEANDEGGFYGTGRGRKPSGENVCYRSLAEDDVSMEAAIAAAVEWAEEYGVPTIWVQREPWNLDSA